LDILPFPSYSFQLHHSWPSIQSTHAVDIIKITTIICIWMTRSVTVCVLRHTSWKYWKARRMRWVWYVARKWWKYKKKNLFGKREGKKLLGRPGSRKVHVFEMGLLEWACVYTLYISFRMVYTVGL
jgi:hypothetical protein